MCYISVEYLGQSNDVMEYEIKSLEEKIAKLKQSDSVVPDELTERRDELKLKLNILQTQVETGSLTQEKYLEGLNQAIQRDKKLLSVYHQKGNQHAVKILTQRIQIMENEVASSLQE